MTEEKEYGQAFIFDIGDEVVMILPSEIDNNYAKTDLSKPHKIISIVDFENSSSGLWYQYIELENAGKFSGLDFRPPDDQMTEESWKHMQDFYQSLRKQRGGRKKRKITKSAKNESSNKTTGKPTKFSFKNDKKK